MPHRTAALAAETTALSEEAQAAYVLLAHGAGVPPGHPGIAELLAFGLILRHPHAPESEFVVRSPADVVAEKRQRIYRAAGAAMKAAEELPQHLQALTMVYQGVETSLRRGAVEYVSGVRDVNARLEEIVSGATEELLTAQPGPRPPATLDIALPRDRDALQRGVTMRTLYRRSARAESATAAYVAAVTAIGADVRTLGEEFMRVVIVDRRIAVATDPTELQPGQDPVRALILHDPGVVGFAAATFERDWDRASTWRGGIAGDGLDQLTEQQQDVMARLVTGRGQPQIAQAMEMSPRALGTIIAQIKEIAGVTTLHELCFWWGRLTAQSV